jgi:hypothetical protein
LPFGSFDASSRKIERIDSACEDWRDLRLGVRAWRGTKKGRLG